MRKLLLFSVLSLGICVAASAQVTVGNVVNTVSKATGNKVSVSGLLTQLAGGIASGSYTSQWAAAKSSWTNSANKVTTAAGAAQLLGQLAGYVKPTAFNSSWASLKTNWASGLKTVNTMQQVGTSIKTLVGSMNNNAFTSSFLSNKNNYLSALSLLK